MRELIQLLDSLPEEQKDFLAVQARDPEGNGFEEVYELGIGWYDRDERELSGHIYDIDDEDELERERTPEECNAVCLWP